MSPESVRELWTRFLSGEALSAEEQAGLVAALDADPALRTELLEDVQLDGALRALGDARRGGDAFAAAVADCLGAERDATRFVRKVEARLADPPLPTSRGGRDSRTNLPRVSRRFHRSGPAGAGWKAALAAAGVFVAVLLLALAASTPPAASARLPKPAPVPAPAPAPPATAPEAVPAKVEQRPVEAPRPTQKEEERAEAKPGRPPGEIEAEMLAEMERFRNQMKASAAAPVPEPKAAPAAPSTVAEAEMPTDLQVESVHGKVYVGGEKNHRRAEKGGVLKAGEDLWTYPGASARLRYPDGTTVDVGGESIVRHQGARPGYRLHLAKGEIGSTIRPQPAERPMVFATEHAEATVLGTTIRLATSPKLGTSLKVTEGRVRLQRLSDRRSVEVAAGRSAVVAESTELASRASFPERFVVNFGPSNTPAPAEFPPFGTCYLDSGAAFDPAKGYGWDGTFDGQPIEGAIWYDEGLKERVQRYKVRGTASRGTAKAGLLKGTDVFTGWEGHAETWKIALPNGPYLVTVCVGDPTYEQGPHRIQVEDRVLVNNVITRSTVNGGFVEVRERIEVLDGELTMKVGGCKGKSSDGSSDTILNYVAIQRAPGHGK